MTLYHAYEKATFRFPLHVERATYSPDSIFTLGNALTSKLFPGSGCGCSARLTYILNKDSYPYFFILPLYGFLEVTDLTITDFLFLLQLADFLMVGKGQQKERQKKTGNWKEIKNGKTGQDRKEANRLRHSKCRSEAIHHLHLGHHRRQSHFVTQQLQPFQEDKTWP